MLLSRLFSRPSLVYLCPSRVTNFNRVMEIIGATSAGEVLSEEFGDGNLNLVFRCT